MSAETLQKKVEKVETAISRNREQYDRLTAELEELHKTQKAIQSKELMKAIADSPRSYEEILRYIQGGNDCESD
jgi:molecular chaperone GrpE (heat shock protein)